MADVDSHGTFTAQGSFLPDRFIKDFGGKYFSGILHQKMQNGILRGCQGNSVPIHCDGFGPVVQCNAADRDTAVLFRTAANVLNIQTVNAVGFLTSAALAALTFFAGRGMLRIIRDDLLDGEV